MIEATPIRDPLDEKVKNLIKDWMIDRNIYRDDNITTKDVSFQLTGVNTLGIGFLVVQPISVKRTVVFISRVELATEHYELLKSLPVAEREEFLFDLRRDLIFQSPDFKFEPSIPKFIQFSKEMMFDELTEGKIRETIERLTRCVLWVAWKMNKRFGGQEKKK